MPTYNETFDQIAHQLLLSVKVFLIVIIHDLDTHIAPKQALSWQTELLRITAIVSGKNTSPLQFSII